MRLQHHAHDGTFQSQGGIITGNDDVDFASLWHRCGSQRGFGVGVVQISRYFNADLLGIEQKLRFLSDGSAAGLHPARVLKCVSEGCRRCEHCF